MLEKVRSILKQSVIGLNSLQIPELFRKQLFIFRLMDGALVAGGAARQGALLAAAALLLLVATNACVKFAEDAPKATAGVLNLREWNFLQKGIVSLDGEWEFYWKELRNPSDFATDKKSSEFFFPFPGPWNGKTLVNKAGRKLKLEPHGYATYRLKLLLPKGEPPPAFKLFDMNTAYRLFSNGREIASNGVPGTSKENMTPQWRPLTAFQKIQADEIELILQVSNFEWSKGGAWRPIYLGDVEQIRDFREQKLALELSLGAIAFIIGLYYVFFYFLRRQEKASLVFGIWGLLFALYSLVHGERFLAYLAPGIDWHLDVRLAHVLHAYNTFAIPLFMSLMFPAEYSRRFRNVLLLFGLANGIAVLFLPPQVFSFNIAAFTSAYRV